MSAVLALAVMLAPAPYAWAGPPGGGRFTPPLPAAELPTGQITVKVVGKGMSDVRAGQQVSLLRQQQGGFVKQQTAASDADGRARFTGLEAGARYQLAVGAARSLTFTGPASGGLRFLLFKEASVSAMTGGSGPPPGKPSGSKPSGQMPPGHPPVSGDKPRLPGGEGAATVQPDKQLPAGQLRVMVRKGKAKTPVKGARVVLIPKSQLELVKGHPMMAKRAGRRMLTDAGGQALMTLSALERAAAPLVLMAVHDDLTYRSSAIKVPTEHGLEVSFQVYDRTSSTAALKLAPGVQLLSQVTEGSVSFMQVVTVLNSGDKVIDPGQAGLVLPLFEGAQNLEVHRVYKELIHVDKKRGQLRLMTPLPPGPLELRYFFEVPYEGATLDLRMRLPWASAAGQASLLGAASIKLLGPAVKGIEQRQVKGHSEGRRVYQLSTAPAGGTLELTYMGLPHRQRHVATAVIVLAGLLVLWAILAAAIGASATRARRRQRDQLLDQLYLLSCSDDQPGDADRRRARLMEQLRAVWDGEP